MYCRLELLSHFQYYYHQLVEDVMKIQILFCSLMPTGIPHFCLICQNTKKQIKMLFDSILNFMEFFVAKTNKS